MQSPRTLAFYAAILGLLSSAHAIPVDLNYGLVAHLAFDGNAEDVSGNGNDGTINGLSWTADRFGNANSALKFDKNGYVQINNNLLLNGATSGAIAGWFNNRLTPNEYGFIFGAGDSRAGLDPLVLAFFGGDSITQSIFAQTTRGPSASNRDVGVKEAAEAVTLPQNEWTSFVMQFASIGSTSIFQLYFDGELTREFTYNYSLRVDYDQPMPVQIGALTGYQDTQFRGEIDDIRVYNRALNTEEIGVLNGSRVPDTGATALYLGLGLAGLFCATQRRVTAVHFGISRP